MNITFKRISRLWMAGFALLGLGTLGSCLSDESDPGADTGGTGGTPGTGGSSAGTGGAAAGTGGSTAGTGGATAGSGGTGGGSPTGTVCAAPIVLAATTPAIADFDDYDGSADLSVWSFALGGNSATGVFAGTFVYGDEPTGFPETFAMVAGSDSTYALSISDTLAEEYGGGLGLWISECLDATAFSGISFWVRGNGPTATAKLSLLMEETTSATATTPDDSIGTCMGTDMTCVHPSFTFPVTDTWTQIEVPWSSVMPGNAAGTTVVADGSNIWQIQFDIGLVWTTDTAGVSHPTPAPYEFVVDNLTFY